jgi:hypothetical protein
MIIKTAYYYIVYHTQSNVIIFKIIDFPYTDLPRLLLLQVASLQLFYMLFMVRFLN